MREIKFRAWNGKEMHYNTSHLELWKKKQYEIMQYTGLKDKNGKEIYEGDLMLSDGTEGIVIFNEGEFVVLENTDDDDKTTWPMRCWCGDEGEVIRNIYNDSHLL